MAVLSKLRERLKALKARSTKLELDVLGTVIVRKMPTAEAFKFAESKLTGMNAFIKLATTILYDEDGNKAFTEEDIPMLEELDFDLTQSLLDACMEHCGLDEIEKNSTRGKRGRTS